MQLVFVDDTKQNGRRTDMGVLMALGGVSFPEDSVAEFGKEFHALYAKYGVPVAEELKWSTPKTSWFRTDAGREVLTPIREDCLRLAAAHNASAVVVAFDLGRTMVQGAKAESQVLTYLYERVTMMLGREGVKRAVIVCDKPGGGHQEEDSWIAGTLDLTRYGTEFVKPTGIILPVLTAPSHHHPHLQLADLVTGSLVAAVAGTDHGMALVDLVKPLLHKNALGLMGATGLKLFPDDLNNLYHWVLAEETYAKVSMNAGVGLPWDKSGWAYSHDNGLNC